MFLDWTGAVFRIWQQNSGSLGSYYEIQIIMVDRMAASGDGIK